MLAFSLLAVGVPGLGSGVGRVVGSVAMEVEIREGKGHVMSV
jgi:hypothetical protein